jgi:hypothetical protein
MWLMIKNHDGTGSFLSVVAHDTEDGFVLVRARTREHLAHAFDFEIENGPYEIEEDLVADYRWRLVLPKDLLMDYLVDAVDRLDYVSHVKEELTARDNDFYDALLSCWTALYRLQSPYDRRRYDRYRYGDHSGQGSFTWKTPEPGSATAVLDHLDRALHPDPPYANYDAPAEDDAALDTLLAQSLRKSTSEHPHTAQEIDPLFCWVCGEEVDRETAHTYHAVGCPCRTVDLPADPHCHRLNGCGEDVHEEHCPSCHPPTSAKST